MPDIPVNVNVNLTGVSYQNGTWSGTPSWTFVPDTAHAFEGSNTINWSLHAANPAGGYTSAFPGSGAVVFKTTDNPPWSGATPATQSATSVTVPDTVQNQVTEVTYHYVTSVVLTAPDGTTSKTFTHDPAVQNDPGGVLCHCVAAAV